MAADPLVESVSTRSGHRVPSLWIVALIWAAMFATALGLVTTYGTRTLPQSDELWALYDAGPGIHVHWLWQTWAEHRIPLAKLIWKAVLQATNYDFRAGNFLTVAILAALALALVWTAGKLRGRVSAADTFFPLALLNFGQAHVFLWWWQINHVLAPALAILILIVLVTHGKNLKLRQAGSIGVALILFVLCGPGGLPYAIALAFWLFVWSVTAWSLHNEPQWRRVVFVLLPVLIALGLAGLYFLAYRPYFPINDPPTLSSWAPFPGPAAAAMTFLQILGLSLGTATKPYATLCGLAVLAFGIATTGIAIHVFLRRLAERWRVSGLLTLIAAQAGIVCVIAWSRAGMGLDYIYQGHYLTIVAPALCCFYFVWEIGGGRFRSFAQFSMALVLAALVPANYLQAKQTGLGLQQETLAFERDVRDGVPASVIAEHHFASDVVPRAEKITRILTAHKANGIGIFKEIRDEPRSRIEHLPSDATAVDGIVFRDGMAQSNNGTSSLTFGLLKPQHVYAVRLRYAYVATSDRWPALRIYWRDSTAEDFADKRMYVSTVAGPDQPTWALIDGKIHTDAKVRSDRVLTVWVDRTIDQFKIYPDTVSCEFRLPEVEVLLPTLR
jgi:hypothetical protein